MNKTASNSFQGKERYAHDDDFFNDQSGVQKEVNENPFNLPDIGWLIKGGIALATKYFVLAKYQFFKRTQYLQWNLNWQLPFRLNWFQVALLVCVAYIAFQKDLSFSVNMSSLDQIAMDKEDGQTVSHHSMATGFSTPNLQAKKASAFADIPTDSKEVKAIKKYIRRFKEVAQTESDKFGIPASVKMAQAIVESSAGRSKLSIHNNNHFGIKCFSKKCGKGHCSNFGDDHHKDFFIKYSSAWESWRAHSKFIEKKRYQSLAQKGTDYRAWAQGLSDLGYATDPDYAQKLINTIEKYQLYLLD